MENGGLKTTTIEDSPTSEAPLYSLYVEVLPPPGETCESKPAAGARVAPISMDEERVDSEIPCVQMDFQFISGVAV